MAGRLLWTLPSWDYSELSSRSRSLQVVLLDAGACINAEQAQAKPLQQLLGAQGGAAVAADLRASFTRFAALGSRDAAVAWMKEGAAVELDSARFLKFCQQSGLMSRSGRKPLTTTSVDLIFTAASTKGITRKRLAFEQFVHALSLVAQAKGMGLLQVCRAMATTTPALHATTCDPVRLHDDPAAHSGGWACGRVASLLPQS